MEKQRTRKRNERITLIELIWQSMELEAPPAEEFVDKPEVLAALQHYLSDCLEEARVGVKKAMARLRKRKESETDAAALARICPLLFNSHAALLYSAMLLMRQSRELRDLRETVRRLEARVD